MKAQIKLLLEDNNLFEGIFEGSPFDLALMLHEMGLVSTQNKSAIYMAAAALLKDDDNTETAKRVWSEIEKINLK